MATSWSNSNRAARDAVGGVGVPADLERRPVAPHVGVADLHPDGGQLGQALLAGGLAHPGAGLERRAHLGEDGLDHGHGPLLGGRGEGLGDVDLPEGLAHVGAEGGQHPLVALLLLLLALDQAAVEGEVLVVEGGGQRLGRRVEDVEAGVRAQHRGVGVGQDAGQRGHVPRLLDVERGDVAEPERHQVGPDREARGEGVELVEGVAVEGVARVAALLALELLLGEAGLELEDRGGLGRRDLGVVAHVHQLGGHVGDVGLAQGDGGLAVVGVGVAVGQAEPGGHEPQEVGRGVVVVDGDGLAEQQQEAVAVQLGQRGEQVGRAGDGLDQVELAADRVEAGGLDGGGVHGGGEVVAQLAVDVVDRGLGRLLDDPVEDRLVADADLLERAPRAVARRDRVGVDPAAVGEAVEVVAGVDRGVAIGSVEGHAGAPVSVERTVWPSAPALGWPGRAQATWAEPGTARSGGRP